MQYPYKELKDWNVYPSQHSKDGKSPSAFGNIPQ